MAVGWVRRVAPDAASALAPAQPVELAPERSQRRNPCAFSHCVLAAGLPESQRLFLPAWVLESRPECQKVVWHALLQCVDELWLTECKRRRGSRSLAVIGIITCWPYVGLRRLSLEPRWRAGRCGYCGQADVAEHKSMVLLGNSLVPQRLIRRARACVCVCLF